MEIEENREHFKLQNIGSQLNAELGQEHSRAVNSTRSRAVKSSQEHSKAVKSSQEHSRAEKSSQEHSKAVKSSQEHQVKSTQEQSRAPGQEQSRAVTNSQEQSRAVKSSQEHQAKSTRSRALRSSQEHQVKRRQKQSRALKSSQEHQVKSTLEQSRVPGQEQSRALKSSQEQSRALKTRTVKSTRQLAVLGCDAGLLNMIDYIEHLNKACVKAVYNIMSSFYRTIGFLSELEPSKSINLVVKINKSLTKE